jgi:hypothetical protein
MGEIAHGDRIMAKQKVGVTVLVADSHKDDMTKVATALKHKGFVLKETMEAIGVLTGSVAADAVAELSSVPGVSSVEKERSDYHTQG